MYGFIYITTNHVNGKKYIGQKHYDTKGDWQNYLGSGIALKAAIRKYGISSFSKEIIEECETKEILCERERYWISYYNAVNRQDFYNLAKGGDGGNTIAGYSEERLKEYRENKSKVHSKTVLKGENSPCSKLTQSDVLKIASLLKQNVYSGDIAKQFGVKPSTIDDIYFHRTWAEITKDMVFPSRKDNRARQSNLKRVIQCDLDSNYIAEYESVHEAGRQTGIGFRMISRVCNGNRPYTHGYIFKYA